VIAIVHTDTENKCKKVMDAAFCKDGGKQMTIPHMNLETR
jgi:hypothetical protein